MDSAKTWNGAKIVCQGKTWKGAQGHLASVHSKEENIFVASLATETIWLGGYDLHKSGLGLMALLSHTVTGTQENQTIMGTMRIA